MLEQLSQLSDALGAVSKDQVRQIIEAVNRRLEALLSPQMIKIYWKEKAEGSGTVLQPLTFINNSGDPDPRPFQLNAQGDGKIYINPPKYSVLVFKQKWGAIQ